MQTSEIKIIFPVIISVDQFDTQTARLGGVYPEIKIVLVDSKIGLHEFSIMKLLPHTHPTILLPTIAEAEDQISIFLNILSYVRETLIKPTGEVLYEFNNTRHIVTPKPKNYTGPNLIGVAGEGWFDANISDFHKKYNLDLLKRYNYSRSIDEPIGKFVSLYSLLSSLAGDKQKNIDTLIESFDSSVAKYIPEGRPIETIYTRLRNELAHIRQGTSIIKTHSEIELHLPKFEWIVKNILKKHIVTG